MPVSDYHITHHPRADDDSVSMRFLLLALVLTGVFLFLRWQYRQSPRRLYSWLAAIAGIGLIALVVTGRAHWLVGVVGGILPFLGKAAILLRWLPFLSWARRAYGPASVHLQTAWLDVTIDRASGAIDGTVRQGEFAGRKLSRLDLPQLEALLRACQGDPQSVALLRTYLSRTRAGWQDRGPGERAGTDDFEEAAMSAETAAQILGVPAGAPESEIRAAHRTLAQKLHPDRGGNDYLTRKINQARETLLKNRRGR